MTDIFSEVDKNVRDEQLAGWWQSWRPFVYGAVAALIGSVAVYEFIVKPQMQAARAARALELENAVKALEDGQYEAAEAAFRAIVASDTKLSPLAAHYLAQTQLEGGGDAAAAAEALMAAGNLEGSPYQRLAVLKAAYFKADALTLAELETTLGTLPSEETALGALARELVAAKAYATGDAARARTEYSKLKFDAAAPPGVLQRAEIALDAIPVAAGTTPETETAPEAPAETPAEQPQEPGQ